MEIKLQRLFYDQDFVSSKAEGGDRLTAAHLLQALADWIIIIAKGRKLIDYDYLILSLGLFVGLLQTLFGCWVSQTVTNVNSFRFTYVNLITKTCPRPSQIEIKSGQVQFACVTTSHIFPCFFHFLGIFQFLSLKVSIST